MQTSKAEEPVAIKADGATIGHYVPVRRQRTEADRIALREAHARVRAEMAALGVTEDEIMEDFEQLKAAERAVRHTSR